MNIISRVSCILSAAALAIFAPIILLTPGATIADGPLTLESQTQDGGILSQNACGLEFPGSDNSKMLVNKLDINAPNQIINVNDACAPNCACVSNAVQDGGDADDQCGGTQEWWPFTNHSLDNTYDAGHVFYLKLTDVNSWARADCSSGNFNVYQTNSSSSSGREWVRYTGAAPGSFRYYINVLCSDSKGQAWALNHDINTGFATLCVPSPMSCFGDAIWEED